MSGWLIAVAIMLLVLAVGAGPWWPRVWLGLTLSGAAAAVGAAMTVFATGAEWDWLPGFLLGGEALHLRLDGLSGLFVVLVAVVGGAAAVYSRGY